jgi:thymidylate kinase
MIIILNGPLGIGKSTLAEMLTESVESCVMLDGDRLVAMNPPPTNEREYVHDVMALLIAHHRQAGYRHFVLDFLWRSVDDLSDLRARLARVAPEEPVHCFLLTASLEENLRRIRSRQQARAIDEREFELQTVMDERASLAGRPDVGEPLDVSGPPIAVAEELRKRLGLYGAQPDVSARAV